MPLTALSVISHLAFSFLTDQIGDQRRKTRVRDLFCNTQNPSRLFTVVPGARLIKWIARLVCATIVHVHSILRGRP